MTSQSPPGLSPNYAFFVTKEVVKAAMAYLTDDLHLHLKEHLEQNCPPGCHDWAKRVTEILSEAECRYYNQFNLAEAFAEVLER